MGDLPRHLRTAGLLLALAVVVGSHGMMTAAQQRASEEDLVERFELRPHLAARFVDAYHEELAAYQRAIAVARLASRRTTRR
jgi:hypothetical protein